MERLSRLLKNQGASKPTIDNICRIFEVKGHTSFTSGDVVIILGCAQSTASDFVKKCGINIVS